MEYVSKVFKLKPHSPLDKLIGEFANVQVSEDSFVVHGKLEKLEALSKSPYCLSSRDLTFPSSIWKNQYTYLGDFPCGEKIDIDLRLKKELGNILYINQSEIPNGIFFENGRLRGTIHNPTGVIDIKIQAKYQNEINHEERTYRIRFYRDINEAKSFTDSNYIKLGYGKDLIDYNPNETYYRYFYGRNKKVGPPLEEAALAAKKIQAMANGRPISLLVSGGVDSQCMTQAFIHARVDFQAYLITDINGCNQDDVIHAKKFFSKIDRPLIQIPFDYIQYIKSYSYYEAAMSYRFNNPEYGILLNFMDQVPGVPVYAGRPISINSDDIRQHRIIGLAGDEQWSKARFLERNKRDGVAEFLIHTPELIEAFLQTPYARKFPLGHFWGYREKVNLLKDGGFDVSLAPDIKYTGFEALRPHFIEDEFGSSIWVDHRGPLKLCFPVPSLRNAIKIQNNRIGDPNDVILKAYNDGFSYNYLKNNKIENFH